MIPFPLCLCVLFSGAAVQSIQDSRGNPAKMGEGLSVRGSITQVRKAQPLNWEVTCNKKSILSHCDIAFLWIRAHQLCPSPASRLTSWRAQSQSWPQRTWAARTKLGGSSWQKVTSSMKERVVTSSPMMVRTFNELTSFPVHLNSGKIFDHLFFCWKAIKNPRENTRSPRTGHELKRTYDMMEGPMGRGHPGREGAPFEGVDLVLMSELCIVLCFSCVRAVMGLVYFSGLISRALPRDGLHGDSKERPLITGSIMQGIWVWRTPTDQ